MSCVYMDKQIHIEGTNNRYMMKKVLHKRIVHEKKRNCSDIPNDQLIVLTNEDVQDGAIAKTMNQQINKKIAGYKQQDIKRNFYNPSLFINKSDVIVKMIECELKCRYCLQDMLILYDTVREPRQWTVDRIDNNHGHNNNNFHLACLECNLRRKKMSDEKFLFTKQFKLIKQNSIV